MRNPLSASRDIDNLVAELRKEDSDAKTVAKLYTKIMAKGFVNGLLISAAAVVTVTGIAIAVGAVEYESDDQNEE